MLQHFTHILILLRIRNVQVVLMQHWSADVNEHLFHSKEQSAEGDGKNIGHAGAGTLLLK